jgi:hypothetical protein
MKMITDLKTSIEEVWRVPIICYSWNLLTRDERRNRYSAATSECNSEIAWMEVGILRPPAGLLSRECANAVNDDFLRISRTSELRIKK